MGRKGAEVDNAAKATHATSEASPPPSPSVRQLVEAILFRGGVPLSAECAAEIVRGLSQTQFQQVIQDLNLDYRRQGRPYSIHREHNGYVVRLSAQFKSVEERLYGLNRQARLSSAAIDVLSLVAY